MSNEMNHLEASTALKQDSTSKPDISKFDDLLKSIYGEPEEESIQSKLGNSEYSKNYIAPANPGRIQEALPSSGGRVPMPCFDLKEILGDFKLNGNR